MFTRTRILKFTAVASIIAAVLFGPATASSDPGIGSDAAFPFAGVASDTVLEPPPGAPVVPAPAPPPATVILSLLAPLLPPGAGEVQDFSYGNDFATAGPLNIEFSVGPDFGGGASAGHPGSPAPGLPGFNLRQEAGVFLPPPFGDGFVDSDIYQNFPGPLLGPPPCGPIGTNRQILDGSGGAGPIAPRLGLSMPEPGSNIDAYERSDEDVVDFIPVAGDGIPDAPIFFTVDGPTAGALPPLPAPGFVFAAPGPGDVLAWNPGIGGPVIWATAAALGLGPGDDIDALAVSYTSGIPLPPAGPGWNFAPAADHIVYSLANGSPSVSPASGGAGASPQPTLCFGPGFVSAGDLFLVAGGPVPFGGAAPYIDAEMLGLNTPRSGGVAADDELDAVDICNTIMMTDIDGDLIDDGCDFDKDGDGTGDYIDPDDDGDGFGDAQSTTHQGPANTVVGTDNCPMVPNPTQANADGNFIDMTPPKLFDDLSIPNSDMFGDACDPDDDNDGRSDANEASGAGCAGVATMPLVRDTDGDHALDGAECAIGTNPTVLAAEPTLAMCVAASAAGDGDGDAVLSAREFCYYNSTYTVVNTDADTRNDGCEVYSVNADLTVNVIDLQQVASESGAYVSPGSSVKVNYDVTKDGTINVIDLQQVAAGDGVCP